MFVLSSLGVAVAQEPPKATVTTKKGDTVEGTFLGATAIELSMEVAGQQLKIPIAEIRYLTFVGSAEPTAAVAEKSAPGSLGDLVAALDEIEDMFLRGDVVPGHVPDKFNEATARVAAYWTAHGTDSDLATALEWALLQYTFPLYPWFLRNVSWTEWEEAPHTLWAASAYAAYAKELAKGTSPHQETSEVRTLTPGQQVKGRLGRGDRTVPAGIDKHHTGTVADVYELNLDAKEELIFTLSGAPCDPALLILDSRGKKIADERSPLEWMKSLGPGVYQVWVVCGTVGTYTLWTSVGR